MYLKAFSWILAVSLGFTAVVLATEQPTNRVQLFDEAALATLTQFDTPGIALAVLKDGQLVHLAGYGERELSSAAPVTADTYFRLASASKAFTAASVAILVDEGKLSWDDKVKIGRAHV